MENRVKVFSYRKSFDIMEVWTKWKSELINISLTYFFSLV